MAGQLVGAHSAFVSPVWCQNDQTAAATGSGCTCCRSVYLISILYIISYLELHCRYKVCNFSLHRYHSFQVPRLLRRRGRRLPRLATATTTLTRSAWAGASDCRWVSASGPWVSLVLIFLLWPNNFIIVCCYSAQEFLWPRPPAQLRPLLWAGSARRPLTRTAAPPPRWT